MVLTWTRNSAGATGYNNRARHRQRKLHIPRLGHGSTSTFTNTNATAATMYYYRVYATGTGGPSDYSDSGPSITKPAAPQNVTATATSATVVNLHWAPVSGATATTFCVQRQHRL